MILSTPRLGTCPAKTLENVTSRSPVMCAAACNLHTNCHAFSYSKPNACELLSTPWRNPPTDKDQKLMMRQTESPKTRTWRFNGSEYKVTEKKGSFDESKSECASRGMHLWYPNSQNEIDFVEQEIVCQLPKEFMHMPGWSDGKSFEANLWFGVIDKPNGNCLLADDATKCPVKKYHKGYPRKESFTCHLILWRNDTFAWIDTSCNYQKFGICEKDTTDRSK